MGVKIAQRNHAGFSRIPAEFLTSNRHDGLYAYRVNHQMNGHLKDVIDLREMEKHLVKERKKKNAERRNFQRKKMQKVKKSFCGKKKSSNGHGSYWCRACENKSHYAHTREYPLITAPKRTTAFIPRELKERTKSTVRQSNFPNKNARILFEKPVQKKLQNKKKSGVSSPSNCNAAKILIMTLRGKF